MSTIKTTLENAINGSLIGLSKSQVARAKKAGVTNVSVGYSVGGIHRLYDEDGAELFYISRSGRLIRTSEF